MYHVKNLKGPVPFKLVSVCMRDEILPFLYLAAPTRCCCAPCVTSTWAS